MMNFRRHAGNAPAAFVSPLSRGLLVAALFAVPFVQAADSPADAAARNALKQLVPQAKVDTIEQAPLPGFRQVIVGGQMVYVSDDGQYLMQGTLYDIQAKRDLTGARLAVESKRKVDAVGVDKRIVFAPSGKAKYKITVFTDIDCGYCRRLHSQIAEYNRLGIRVRYLFYPRSGPDTDSWHKAEAVWCASNRNDSLTRAKNGEDIKSPKCPTDIVKRDYELGHKLGIEGTPAIFLASGEMLPGYAPPTQLLQYLKTGKM
jgi:thiol:disulfide interchange protein DsbC